MPKRKTENRVPINSAPTVSVRSIWMRPVDILEGGQTVCKTWNLSRGAKKAHASTPVFLSIHGRHRDLSSWILDRQIGVDALKVAWRGQVQLWRSVDSTSARCVTCKAPSKNVSAFRYRKSKTYPVLERCSFLLQHDNGGARSPCSFVQVKGRTNVNASEESRAIRELPAICQSIPGYGQKAIHDSAYSRVPSAWEEAQAYVQPCPLPLSLSPYPLKR